MILTALNEDQINQLKQQYLSKIDRLQTEIAGLKLEEEICVSALNRILELQKGKDKPVEKKPVEALPAEEKDDDLGEELSKIFNDYTR